MEENSATTRVPANVYHHCLVISGTVHLASKVCFALNRADAGVPCSVRAYARKLPGCDVRTVSPAMLARKCSGRTRSQTASEARTRARN